MADPVVSELPIRLSNTLAPNIHIHQFPLLTRPLQAPPSALNSGKKIRARVKPKASLIEIHVPADTRPDVWNRERSNELGQARTQDDFERDAKKPTEDQDTRLTEIRLRSEQIPMRGVYMLGILRNGELHLHPISQMHQLRPTLTYVNVHMRKSVKRSKLNDEDSDSDDGPPPDPDEVAVPPPTVKKEKKMVGEVKEVHVSAKKSDEKSAQASTGGLSGVRREFLSLLREEEEEKWKDLEFLDGLDESASSSFTNILSSNEKPLECKSNLLDFLKIGNL